MGSLPKDFSYSKTLLDCSKLLDKHYILTRYPNGFDSGAPTDYYTKQEGEQAIACAEKIVKFCKDHLNTA